MLLLLLLLPHLSQAGPFTGHRLLRTLPSTPGQVVALQSLRHHLHLDFWSEGGPGRPLDLRVAPDQEEAVVSFLLAQNISSSVLHLDVQELVERDWMVAPNSSYSPLTGHAMDWTSYHSVEDMHGYMEHLAAAYPWVTIESIGQSYEGRDMKVLRVCRSGQCGGKPAVWIDGGIHAREWVSPAVATFLMSELVEREADHPDLTKLDWYILPVANPDGYAYSAKDYTTRMWRKTRSMDPDGLGLCLGCDANRNWGFHFGDGGSSDDPCLDIFMGAEAFSEVENRNMRDFLLAHGPDVKVYTNLHSFSQLVLLPWGYTEDKPDSYSTLEAMANIGNAALQATHGQTYEVGS